MVETSKTGAAAQALSQDDKAALFASVPILTHMGIKIEHYQRGAVKLCLPCAANVNHLGTIYAGSLFSLAETIGGVLFSTLFDFKDYVPVVAKFDIKFIKPALTDVTVEASFNQDEIKRLETELKTTGTARFALALTLKDKANVSVAETNGYYSALKLRA